MLRPLRTLLLAAAALPVAGPVAASAETCRFSGTTSYGGQVAVRADAARLDDLLTLDVTVELSVHAWLTDYRFLGEEITSWALRTGGPPELRAPELRPPELRSLLVNQRSLADGRVTRQQWDVFTRHGPRLDAFRIQGRVPSDLRNRFPLFAAHWPPSSFGQPWLADFARAGAERRADLDLPAGDVRSPLAFAFFWSRVLPPGGEAVSLVLPGFKRDKQVSVVAGPSAPDPAAPPGEGWRRWTAPLLHPALEPGPGSDATAWVSPDHHLLQLSLGLRTFWATGRAVLRAGGCEGAPALPRP